MRFHLAVVWAIVVLLAAAGGAPAAQMMNEAVTKQFDTAILHAKNAAGAATEQQVELHLHHVINCIEGKDGRNYFTASGDVCQGMGQGLLKDLQAAGMAGGFNDLISELFTSIHNELLKLGYSYEECAGMGATLSLCWLTPEWMYFGHVGDSRIYYLPRDGGMTQVTHDHSHVGWLRRQGKINEREARTHPRKNALQMALGAGHQFIDPHIGAVGHRPGDKFLICSDGLIDGLWDRQLHELLRTPAPDDAMSPAQRLVHEAVQNSGRDNTTAVVVEIGEAPPRSETPPAGS